MRLLCPNCDAQYEVDIAAIPEAGRDVQCSNCGHAWFQLPPDLEAELAEEDALLGAVTTAPVAPPVMPPVPEPEAEAAPAEEESGDAPDATEPEAAVPAEDSQDEEMTPPPFAPRRGLDESLLAVLREEADREAAVRRAETPRPLETQPDLGLEEATGAASAAKAVRERLARLRGPETDLDMEPEAEMEAGEKPAARRDLLPDIEEINSTLRASSENRHDGDGGMSPEPAPPEQSRTGFRSGFAMMMLIAVLLVLIYVSAPNIAERFPAAGGALGSYVTAVDAGRVWLDQAMSSAVLGLQGLTGGAD